MDRFLKRNPNTCFVFIYDGEIVGTILAGNDGRLGYLYYVAVKPSLRGKGIGSRMVDAALEALRGEGIIKATLVVYTHNEDGIRFWENYGFTSRDDLVYQNMLLEQNFDDASTNQ